MQHRHDGTHTGGVSLPPVCVPSVGDVVIDNVSVVLLQRYSPWILQQFMPVTVGADGNCFFRAVSVALYGTESACSITSSLSH